MKHSGVTRATEPWTGLGKCTYDYVQTYFFQNKLFHLGSFSISNCIKKYTFVLLTKRNAEITTKFVSTTHPTHTQHKHAACTTYTTHVAPTDIWRPCWRVLSYHSCYLTLPPRCTFPSSHRVRIDGILVWSVLSIHHVGTRLRRLNIWCLQWYHYLRHPCTTSFHPHSPLQGHIIR